MYNYPTGRRRARQQLKEDEENEPTSERESWWQYYLRDTPVPGTYEMVDFVEERQRRPATYNFKSVGRNRDIQRSNGKGDMLLPGAYHFQDLYERLKGDRSTYGFRNTPRSTAEVKSLVQDKAADLGPGSYETQVYDSTGSEKSSNKNWFFKSNVQRFPTIYFKPKDGVPPGTYQIKNRRSSTAQAIRGTSCFVSKTPRFTPSNTKTPGPGAYEKTIQYPMPPSVYQMARVHGVFFNSDLHL